MKGGNDGIRGLKRRQVVARLRSRRNLLRLSIVAEIAVLDGSKLGRLAYLGL